MNARFATPQSASDSQWEMPLGVVLSVVLHVLIFFFAVFGLPFLSEPPPQVEEAIPVDLAPLAEKTTVAPPKSEEQRPVEKPPEPPKQQEPKPEPPKEEPKPTPPPPPPPPAPTPPPPPPAPTPPPPEPKAEVPLPAPEKKPEPPKPEQPPPPDKLADVKPPPKKPPPPKDDFQSLLKTLDQMKQAPKPDKPDKPQKPKDDMADLEKTLQDMQKNEPAPAPPSEQKVAASTPQAEISAQPTASEIGMVTHQVEIHWNFDIGSRDAADLIVQVHVELQPDGTVSRAELVDDPRYNSDTFFRSAAESARRAVLAASPLKLPPNSYDKFKSFTFRFDPRNAVR